MSSGFGDCHSLIREDLCRILVLASTWIANLSVSIEIKDSGSANRGLVETGAFMYVNVFRSRKLKHRTERLGFMWFARQYISMMKASLFECKLEKTADLRARSSQSLQILNLCVGIGEAAPTIFHFLSVCVAAILISECSCLRAGQ